MPYFMFLCRRILDAIVNPLLHYNINCCKKIERRRNVALAKTPTCLLDCVCIIDYYTIRVNYFNIFDSVNLLSVGNG